MTRSLDRLRIAFRFSLWTWALYWPGGGILLLSHGLDPVSLAVVLGSLATFVVLALGGALRAESSRNMREFLVERPLYLIAAFVGLAMLAPLFLAAVDGGLALFSGLHLAAIAYVGIRTQRHVAASGRSALAIRADQVYVVVAMAGLAALLVFLDAVLPLMGGDPVGGTSLGVALANWVNLLYPPLLLLASRPFRQPLRWPRRARGDPKPSSTSRKGQPDPAA